MSEALYDKDVRAEASKGVRVKIGEDPLWEAGGEDLGGEGMDAGGIKDSKVTAEGARSKESV